MADGRFVRGGINSHANVPRSLTVQLLLFRRAQSVDQMEFGVWLERSDPQQGEGDTNGDRNQQKSPPPDRHGVQSGEADGQPQGNDRESLLWAGDSAPFTIVLDVCTKPTIGEQPVEESL